MTGAVVALLVLVAVHVGPETWSVRSYLRATRPSKRVRKLSRHIGGRIERCGEWHEGRYYTDDALLSFVRGES